MVGIRSSDLDNTKACPIAITDSVPDAGLLASFTVC